MSAPADPHHTPLTALAHDSASDGSTVTGAGREHVLTGQVLDAMGIGYAVLDSQWTILHVNAESQRMTGTAGGALVGQNHWDAFPAMAGSDFEHHYRRAVDTGEVAVFEAFYPHPLDVWVEVRAIPHAGGLQVSFSDVSARHHAQQVSERAHQRLDGISAVALALLEAEDVQDLVTVIAEQGLSMLGCDGGAVAVLDPADPTHLLSYITASYGSVAQADYARLPLDASLPVCVAAATDRRILVPDRVASLAFSPLMRGVLDATGSQAFASLPLRAAGAVIGVLTAGWKAPQAFAAEQLDVLETFAAQCAQALQRLRARDAERAAARAARQSAAQQAALVAVARALGEAQSEADVLAVIAEQGALLLEADGWALCLQEPEGTHMRILTTETFSAEVRARLDRVPVDFPLPAVHSAVTGTPFFHADRAETLAGFPGAEELYVAGGVEASAAVPLNARGRLLGCLSLSFAQARAWRGDEQDLLEGFAALTAQAMSRITSREAERTASREVARFSETLQRSLLTAPPEPDHLQVAVRYSPAAADAQVGGDWYDAFLTAGGATSLVIGDVTGHDSRAAAAMGQLRNLLRGIGHTIGGPPAAVLSALDHAVHDLAVSAMATVVLAQIVQTPDQEAAGLRTLRWSNAGHLPPLLITPDGATRYLEAESDLLLGLDPDTLRADHEVVLQPGASVLLFTDGLVERRGAHLQTGLDWLARAVADLAHLPLEELCDALLAQVGDRTEDDVALLAVRAHPEDAPRPAEAGPGCDPLTAPALTSDQRA